jgi:hypothetical protein
MFRCTFGFRPCSSWYRARRGSALTSFTAPFLVHVSAPLCRQSVLNQWAALAGKHNSKGGAPHKNVVLTLIERGGSARSFHIDSTSTANIEKLMRENIRKESRLMTDEGRHYKPIGRDQP